MLHTSHEFLTLEICKVWCYPPCIPRDSFWEMGSLARNAPDCDSHTANFLAEARSVFDAAVAGKAITSADRDQIAYRFQTLLDEYMSDEKCNAIGTLHDSFDIMCQLFWGN